MPSRPTKRPAKRGPQTRLSPEARRRQLLDAAARVLTEHGVEAVQISEVAQRCQVTRPIVYRFFPTREAMILAVLEDLGSAMDEAFRNALVHSLGQSMDEITRAFVLASCDVIERKGAGPWRLLDARVVGREIGRAGTDLIERLFSPWFARLAELTGTTEAQVAMHVAGIIAMGRSSLDFWIDGVVPKDVAVDHASRGVRVLVEEFARNGQR